MAFKIKDLMINDLSEPRGYQDPFYPIITCSCGPRSLVLACGCTFGSGGPLSPFDPAASLESLKALREQLKQQIAEIDKQEAILEQELPPTVEEVDKLSAKLTEALEALREHRANLDKSKKARD
jgi:septal ring factor EnvC (AmiA/AmiB activator)